ncbi:hypothetical protein [Sporolactobacillus sp. KGMB 08714]|uniref:hypothetical protein n=1 Tax=Sporolactobacillus sp. KGMB 08714 TaxID=3064704 RepID=UPI002FBE7838
MLINRKLMILLLIILLALLTTTAYTSAALSSASDQLSDAQKTLQTAKKENSQLQRELRTQPSDQAAKLTQPTSIVSQPSLSSRNASDLMKSRIQKDTTLVRDFFNSLYTYDARSFNQRYSKASQYCTPDVLKSLVGAGEGVDTSTTHSKAPSVKPISGASGTSQPSKDEGMTAQQIQFFLNTSSTDADTGLVEVNYNWQEDGKTTAGSVSWYQVTISQKNNKITDASIFVPDGAAN